MEQFLSVYCSYLRKGVGEFDALKLTREKLGVNEFFEMGLKLGVCPTKTPPLPYKGRGARDTWVKAFTRAVKGAEARKARDRVHNQILAGPVPHVEPFPSGTPPYMPGYMRMVLSHVHDSNEWRSVISNYSGRVENTVAYFADSKSAHDCRVDLRKIGVTCGSPQKQFASGEFAFEMNIETILVPDPAPEVVVKQLESEFNESARSRAGSTLQEALAAVGELRS